MIALSESSENARSPTTDMSFFLERILDKASRKSLFCASRNTLTLASVFTDRAPNTSGNARSCPNAASPPSCSAPPLYRHNANWTSRVFTVFRAEIHNVPGLRCGSPEEKGDRESVQPRCDRNHTSGHTLKYCPHAKVALLSCLVSRSVNSTVGECSWYLGGKWTALKRRTRDGLFVKCLVPQTYGRGTSRYGVSIGVAPSSGTVIGCKGSTQLNWIGVELRR